MTKITAQKITDIMTKTIIANVENGFTLREAKDQAFNRLERDFPEVLNAWILSHK